MAKCTFWYQLTRVVSDKVQRAVMVVCLCVCVCVHTHVHVSSMVTGLTQPLQTNVFITLYMLPFIPLHFLCTHFWQLAPTCLKEAKLCYKFQTDLFSIYYTIFKYFLLSIINIPLNFRYQCFTVASAKQGFNKLKLSLLSLFTYLKNPKRSSWRSTKCLLW